MKSRSEIMAERKAAAAKSDEKPTKASASSRTLPIPGTDGPAQVHCPDCDTDMRIKDLKKRADGTYECNTCAMPLKFAGGVQIPNEISKLEEIHEPKEKKNGAAKVEARSGAFCGKCGAEWPLMDGKLLMNCGHTDALRVDDPRKAERMMSNTASGVPNPPPGAPSMHVIPSNVSTVVEGDRVTITWGKIIFPIGEAQGVSKFSNMDIGPFSITETFQSSTFVETHRRILANLQKIADMTFDTQFVWYKEKLGLLDK